jgi:colanic acid/amylovoran biosynthesis protein
MKVFMFNHSGSLNRGCEAIVRGTIGIIEKNCPNSEYLLSSFNPEEDAMIENLSEVFAFKPEPLNRAAHLQAAVRIRLMSDERYSVIKSYSAFFEQAARADICLSVGGDTYCYGDNAVIRILTEELKKRGKRVVLWGGSIGPEDLTPEKEKNLACFDAIFARESLTFDLIKSRSLNPSVFRFPDPAFTLKPDELPLPTGWQEKNTIGINISPLVTEKNPALMEITSGFIGYLLRHTDLSIALIPHVTSSSNNDMSVLNDLYKENMTLAKGRLMLLPGDLTAAQYKGYIARMRFLIAARTHASIAAYSSGVPVIVLGYSVKSRGIAQDIFGDRRFVLDTGKLSTAKDLINAFEVLTEQEDETKSKLEKSIPETIKKTYSAGSTLSEI